MIGGAVAAAIAADVISVAAIVAGVAVEVAAGVIFVAAIAAAGARFRHRHFDLRFY